MIIANPGRICVDTHTRGTSMLRAPATFTNGIWCNEKFYAVAFRGSRPHGTLHDFLFRFREDRP